MTTIDQGADMALRIPPIRDEFELPSIIEPAADVECPLPLHVRLLQSTVARRLIVVGTLAVVWQGYATYLDNPLMMPRLSEVIVALVSSLVSGGLGMRILMTMKVLIIGYSVVAAMIPVAGFALPFYRWLHNHRIDQLHRDLGKLERELTQDAGKS
jgi:NitT/TauT family transport system permease protein